MADGPRCKRRKQANPRRNNVTNYNNGLEAGSDTDDDDKLHIVEEAEGAECDSTLPDEEHPREHCWDQLKEEGLSEAEEELSTDALVEEMLQQGDTAVIYPEAPEDELQRLGTPETTVHDENGTPDSFSQLLTCPYCSRGYKRYSSLKEHIKYRHERTEDSFNCSECSYSFAYRAQLDRHMTAHKAGRDQRHITQSASNRKFKCTECGKAFKYKHHLKEHLRIHSGEKPYECSNCKKRFSHSGSYSSHISSKKCISVISVNGRARLGNPKSQAQGPASVLPSTPSIVRTQIREKLEHKPLQEQLPLNQIKTEPVDYEYKPVMVPSAGVFNGGASAPLQGTVQAVVLPTVGLVSPISINIADLQNALKVAVDGNMIRQVLESKGQAQGFTTGVLHPPQQQLISAISLPIVGQDGNAKIIINYSLDQGQVAPQNLKKEPISPTEKIPEDLTVKEAKDEEGKTTKTCLLCDNCPAGLETLHALKHGKGLNGALKSESAMASLLSEGALCTQPKNLLSLLKAYYALNAEPTKDELAKISDSVSLPESVVRKWFDKMQQGALGAPTPPSEEEDSVVSLVPGKVMGVMSPSVSQDSPTEATPAEVNGTHSSPASPSPLNLTAMPDQPSQSSDGPLDLSLPKSTTKTCKPSYSSTGIPDEPLNLTCIKKEQLPGVYGSHILSTQLPALVAMADHSRMQCLRAMGTNSKRTILIPQLAYSFTTTATSPDGTDTKEAAIQLNGIKEERLDTSSEGLSTVDEQNDSDSGLARKKMKKTESGLYACDLCDKIFQKSSSLLRHKYEHTGKRPHECGICAKAFKHKHHLIEHMRLHSGEKPYQCDKCGKRFSHSGSYSQHMNHRYSYCKKEPLTGPQTGNESPSEEPEMDVLNQVSEMIGPFQMDSDERGSSARESEEDEEDDDGAVDLEDIQVVQVGEDEEQEEEQESEKVEDSRQEQEQMMEMDGIEAKEMDGIEAKEMDRNKAKEMDGNEANEMDGNEANEMDKSGQETNSNHEADRGE